jgi:hypothetical protein
MSAMKRLFCVVILLALSGCRGSDDPAKFLNETLPPTGLPNATETATASVQPSAGGYVSTEGTPPPSAAATRTIDPQDVIVPSPDAQGNLNVPNVVGFDLAKSKGYVREYGFQYVSARDLSPQKRPITKDTDWYVCNQDPEAGENVPPDTTITLGALPDTEDCP